MPPAPSVGGFLSAGVARTLGSNSPSRRTDLACPATPSPGMQDMDSVTRNLLVPARPGGGSRSEVALPGARHAAPKSLPPAPGRRSRPPVTLLVLPLRDALERPEGLEALAYPARGEPHHDAGPAVPGEAQAGAGHPARPAEGPRAELVLQAATGPAARARAFSESPARPRRAISLSVREGCLAWARPLARPRSSCRRPYLSSRARTVAALAAAALLAGPSSSLSLVARSLLLTPRWQAKRRLPYPERRGGMQKLMTGEIAKGLPRLYEQDGAEDPMVYVHYFSCVSGWDWWLTEYDPATGEAFGLVRGFATERGYFSVAEMEGLNRSRGFAVVERDECFESIPMSGVADSGKTGAPAGSQSRGARRGRLSLPWTRAFAKRWSLVPHRWLTGLPR